MRIRPQPLYSALLLSAVTLVGSASSPVEVRAEKDVVPARKRVHDAAGLFDAKTNEKAQAKIMEIKRRFQIGVFVETIDDIPEADFRKINRASNRGRAFKGWASQRAAEARVDGVYILISVDSKQRGAVVVLRPSDKYEDKLSPEEVEKLRRRVASKAFYDDPNRELPATLESLAETLATNTAKKKTYIPWLTLSLLLGGGFGVWVLLNLLRFKNRKESDDSTSGSGSSGGGLYPSLLGAVGLWAWR